MKFLKIISFFYYWQSYRSVDGGEAIKYRDEFDIVSLVATFHEILPALRPKVMERAYEALKNDGQLFIIDFSYPEKIEDFRNPSFELGIIDQFIEAQIGTVILNESEVNHMLTQIGFKNIERFLTQGNYALTATK
jgi:SAM-dependent methyltransferase